MKEPEIRPALRRVWLDQPHLHAPLRWGSGLARASRGAAPHHPTAPSTGEAF